MNWLCLTQVKFVHIGIQKYVGHETQLNVGITERKN